MSDDRNATLRVAIVAVRYRSVTSRIAAAWALARPKTLSVGSRRRRRGSARPGAGASRTWAAMRSLGRGADQRHEQRDQRHGDGDDHRRDPVGARDDDDDGDRHDHGQEQLGQVAGEVAVEGVDAAGREHDELTGAAAVEAAGPSAAMRSTSAVRSSDLADADARCADVRWPRPGRPDPPRRRSKAPRASAARVSWST